MLEGGEMQGLQGVARGADESYLGLSKVLVVTNIVGDKKTNGRVYQ